MTREQVAWNLSLGLAATLLVGILNWLGRRLLSRFRGIKSRWRAVSQGLVAAASSAPEQVKACADHGDPTWGDDRSMVRIWEVDRTRQALDRLMPEVAGFYPFGVTVLVKALRDACFRKAESYPQELVELTQSLAQQVVGSARPRFGVRRIIGFKRRQRAIERHDVIAGLRKAASRVVPAMTSALEHQDPVYFSGPNSEQWTAGDSMIRMHQLTEARQDIEALSVRADSLGWREVSRRAESLVAMCASLEPAPYRHPFRVEDVAAVEGLALALRDALNDLPPLVGLGTRLRALAGRVASRKAEAQHRGPDVDPQGREAVREQAAGDDPRQR